MRLGPTRSPPEGVAPLVAKVPAPGPSERPRTSVHSFVSWSMGSFAPVARGGVTQILAMLCRMPTKFIVEGIDGVGKDTLIRSILDELGYHHVIHFSKPLNLRCYGQRACSPEEAFQRASFYAMFNLIRTASDVPVIFNRGHLGECVYAPLYRGYSGDYVFEFERNTSIGSITDVRLVLLVEDFETSKHFRDDGKSLGPVQRRREEQALFEAAFERSQIHDKRKVGVTAPHNGSFREASGVLHEVLRS